VIYTFMMNTSQFYSNAGQDEFAFKLNNKKTNGFYLEIGCGDPIFENNTIFLESIGWSGISIDYVQHDYSNRKNKYFKENALEISYKHFLRENNTPKIIDYLSLDIDLSTTDCLSRLPLNEYTFKVITIEHDAYRFGDGPRSAQRKILTNAGYYLLCADVTTPPLFENQYFEDWWVHPSYINIYNFKHLTCEKEQSKNIRTKLS